MPVLPFEEWRKRWETEGARRLGVRPVSADAEGHARFVIDLPFGDVRDQDEDFLHAALSYAVDVAALAAVLARVDPEREQPNGTAALHLNVVGTPRGAVTVDGRVVHWEVPSALLEVVATDSEGRLIAQGLSPYSLRAKAPEEAS
jgi:acyl-coenzyme A thioesterase PaaI-like protein